MRRTVLIISVAFAALVVSKWSAASTVVVFPEDPTWFKCCGTVAQIGGANPRSGTGSVELSGDGAFIGFKGAPFGTYGDLESVSFDYFIQSFTDPSGQNTSLPPELALRFYSFGAPNTFFLHWDTCSPAAPCVARPVGSWQTVTLTRAQLTLQEADGNPLPQSIPDDAPISEIHLRGSFSFGGPWHGFMDNVTLQFAGQEPITYNFEVHAVPEPQTWLVIGLGLLLLLTRGYRSLRPDHRD